MSRLGTLSTTWILAAAVGTGLTAPSGAVARPIDLSKAVVVVPDGLSGPENKATRLLVEEVRNRSRIEWTVSLRWPTRDVPVIAVGPARLFDSFPRELREQTAGLPARQARRRDSASERPPMATAHRSWPSSATTSVEFSSASAGCSASCSWLPVGLRLQTVSTWPQPRNIPCAGTSLAIGPRPIPTTLGTCAQWERYIRDLADLRHATRSS